MPPPLSSPTVRARVSGVDSPLLSATFLDLIVEDEAAGRATCRVTFLDWGPTEHGTGFLHVDRSLLDLGVPLAIDIDLSDPPSGLFEGHVTGLDGQFSTDRAPQLVVTAESHAPLRAERRTRTFDHTRVATLVQTIAAEHGLRADVRLAAADASSTRTQTDETDLAFIVREAATLQADTWVDASGLHVHDRGTRIARPIRIAVGTTLIESSVQYRAVPASPAHTTQADIRFAGDAPVPVGAIVDLLGVGPLHEGRYFVARATHTWDSRDGFRGRLSGPRR